MTTQETNKPQKKEEATPAKKSINDIQVPNWLAAVIIVGVVGVIGGIYWMNQKPTTLPLDQENHVETNQLENPDNAVVVEVLPQTQRNFTTENSKNPFLSKDLGEVKLKGIVVNDQARYTAIVQTTGASYILEKDQYISGTNWKVDAIDDTSITFSNETSLKTVYMNE